MQVSESATQSEGMTSSTESPLPEETTGSKVTALSTGLAVEKTATTETPPFAIMLKTTVAADDFPTLISVASKDVSGGTNNGQVASSHKVTTSKPLGDSNSRAEATSTTTPDIITEDTKNKWLEILLKWHEDLCQI